MPHQNAKAPKAARKSTPKLTPIPIPAFAPMERPLWLSGFRELVGDKDGCVAELPLFERVGLDVLGIGKEEEKEVPGVLIVALALDAANVGVGVGVAIFVMDIVVAVRLAENPLHRFVPAVYACCKSAALQAPIKQFATAEAGKAHWQATSDEPQLAADIAESKHDVWTWLRFDIL